MSRSTPAVPFLTGSFAEHDLEPWHYVQENVPVFLNEAVPGWDYSVDLHLRRRGRLDLGRIRSECRLPDAALLDVCVSVSCSSSIRREIVWRYGTARDNDVTLEIDLVIDGGNLSESLRLETLVVLAEDVASDHRHAPKYSGTPLAIDSHEVILEGGGSRFPVDLLSFSRNLKRVDAENAYWYFEFLERDLTAPVMRAARLYLNTDHEWIADEFTEDSVVLNRWLALDVVESLANLCLRDPEFTLDPDGYPDESIGAWGATVLRSCFPGVTTEELITLFSSDYERTRAQLQSKTTTWI